MTTANRAVSAAADLAAASGRIVADKFGSAPRESGGGTSGLSSTKFVKFRALFHHAGFLKRIIFAFSFDYRFLMYNNFNICGMLALECQNFCARI